MLYRAVTSASVSQEDGTEARIVEGQSYSDTDATIAALLKRWPSYFTTDAPKKG